MPKVTKIINGEYIGGEKYTITDAGEGKSIISFSPDTVLKEGTPVGAEILNEMQKNGVYSLIGTRNISGQKEIYTCSIEGIVDFGLFDIILIMTPDTTNTTQNVFIDLSGTEFQIVSYSGNIFIGELSLNIPYIFKLNANNKKAFLIGSERLSKGNYNKTAADLKNEIDTKLNKSNYQGDAATLKADIDGKIDKYKNMFGIINDFDDLTTDGFYLMTGSKSASPAVNAPYEAVSLVRVWKFTDSQGTFINQEATSYYDVNMQFTRCFREDVRNVQWEKRYNSKNLPCPFPIGGMYLSVNETHPATIWPGTTWQIIEDKVLIGTKSGTIGPGTTGEWQLYTLTPTFTLNWYSAAMWKRLS